MIKKLVTMHSDKGLDARPIALLVQEASQYSSKIYIEVEDKQINAKSIMGMMSLTFSAGEQFTVIAEGTDEEAAIEGVEKFLANQK